KREQTKRILAGSQRGHGDLFECEKAGRRRLIQIERSKESRETSIDNIQRECAFVNVQRRVREVLNRPQRGGKSDDQPGEPARRNEVQSLLEGLIHRIAFSRERRRSIQNFRSRINGCPGASFLTSSVRSSHGCNCPA